MNKCWEGLDVLMIRKRKHEKAEGEQPLYIPETQAQTRPSVVPTALILHVRLMGSDQATNHLDAESPI